MSALLLLEPLMTVPLPFLDHSLAHVSSRLSGLLSARSMILSKIV